MVTIPSAVAEEAAFKGVLIKNRYYVHYNANYRQMQILGFVPELASQFPLNQQDNYLAITGTN